MQIERVKQREGKRHKPIKKSEEKLLQNFVIILIIEFQNTWKWRKLQKQQKIRKSEAPL